MTAKAATTSETARLLPTDKNGRPIEIGDTVAIDGIVREISVSADTVTIAVDVADPIRPNAWPSKTRLLLEGTQVTVLER